MWDDDAQREFMKNFMSKAAAIRKYFTDLRGFFGEINDAAEKIGGWDTALAEKLRTL